MSWTDERIETLRKLWENGLTASQIADELGGVSRNAVIGKAHRLGLKSRPSPVKTAEDNSEAKATPAKAGAERTARPAPVAKPAAPRVPTPTPAAKAAVPARPSAPAAPVSRTEPEASASVAAPAVPPAEARKPDGPRLVSIGPGGFIRQGPGDQQAPIPPAPPRRRVPAKPTPEMADKTSLLDLNDRICRWPMGHPGEPDFHFCGEAVNPGYPYCVDHCGRAFQAQLPRGTRRPPPPPPFGGPRVR
ncbi:GcrA cell cycle regulator [Sphingomonas lacunae]|uniref:GcrA cell cycle regulator n=1 Tax=Sphingomonas lacunae TaxID=2698828 RepID=A0A6M4AVX3_9SPHN|nr:GcrA family cell cycle regulator [Sphingomonas lacunae]QJQ32866.1 GcrA cell cycle regulator [Sphingomonas lacunae]